MKLRLCAACMLMFALVTAARADLTFPSSFEVVEEEPGQFRLSLTVPLIKGRYMKAKPIVPDTLRPEGEPEARAGSGSLTRTWQVEADPTALAGKIFGLEGLLGTSREVRFLLTTLDGRRHETVLRSTRSVFVVPRPPATRKLFAGAGRDGIRRAVRNMGLWSVLVCVLLSGMSLRIRGGIAAAVCACFLGYWATFVVLSRTGLSDAEFRLVAALFVAGCAAGTAGAIATLCITSCLLAEEVRRRIYMCAGILLSAWIFYQGAGQVCRHGPMWLSVLQRLWQSVVHQWFFPFSSDWAMARIRIPLLTVGALVLFIVALVKIKRARVRFAVSGSLLIMAFTLLPYGVARASVPFLSPDVLSPRQTQRIIGPMLCEIYHALNLKDEGQTYDRLAEQVSGDLVTDLYLDSRRRLVAGTRKGATVEVKQVAVQEVGQPTSTEEQSPSYRCRWTVNAKVTHWQHIHERRNIYEGDLRLVVEDDRWKLAELRLRSEEREVVQGSFQSR